MALKPTLAWTVARFPDGTWTTGGNPTDPDYANCEVWVIEAAGRDAAKRKAQAQRRRQQRQLN